MAEQQEHQTTHSSPYRVIESEPNMDPERNSVGFTINFKFVEPVMFLGILSSSIFGLVAANVIEIQYCKFYLNIDNQSVCLNNTSPHFTALEVFMSTFSMLQTLGLSIFPSIAAIFVGPWSDTFGRRPLMMSGTLGFIVSTALWIWMQNTNLHPYFFLLFDVPFALGGTGVMIMLASYCYICDVTTPDTRTFRMGILFGVNNAAHLTSSLVTPYLQQLGYTLTLTVCIFLSFIAFLYILLFLQESVSTTEIQQRAVSRNPFQWSYIHSIYEVCYLRQTSQTFWILVHAGLLTMTSMVLAKGEATVFYLYLQEGLGWTLVEYTHLLSIEVVTTVLGSCIVTSKILALSDLEILSFGIGFRFLAALVFFFGVQRWLIYVTYPMGKMGSMCGTIARNFVSKIIHSDDLGKVFTLFGLLDAVAPLIGAPIYNMIYSNTLSTYPKMIFLFSAFISLLLLGLILRIINLHFLLLNRQYLLPSASAIVET